MIWLLIIFLALLAICFLQMAYVILTCDKFNYEYNRVKSKMHGRKSLTNYDIDWVLGENRKIKRPEYDDLYDKITTQALKNLNS